MGKAERLKLLGFVEEEISIEGNSTEADIERVLNTIGRGDEFEKLRQDAMEAIEQPDPPTHASSPAEKRRIDDDLSSQLSRLSRRRNKRLGRKDFF